MISFDGPNREITLDENQFVISVEYLYSRWKEWVQLSNNATFPIAFRQSGGDPIGGGVFTGVYFFLQNDTGWRIKPPEANVTISVVGNLYPEDPDLGFLNPTIGQFSTSIRLDTSSNTQVAPLEGLADAVWQRELESAFTAEELTRIMYAVLAGRVSGAGTGTERFRNVANTKDRLVSTVDENGNRSTVVGDGT